METYEHMNVWMSSLCFNVHAQSKNNRSYCVILGNQIHFSQSMKAFQSGWNGVIFFTIFKIFKATCTRVIANNGLIYKETGNSIHRGGFRRGENYEFTRWFQISSNIREYFWESERNFGFFTKSIQLNLPLNSPGKLWSSRYCPIIL